MNQKLSIEFRNWIHDFNDTLFSHISLFNHSTSLHSQLAILNFLREAFKKYSNIFYNEPDSEYFINYYITQSAFTTFSSYYILHLGNMMHVLACHVNATFKFQIKKIIYHTTGAYCIQCVCPDLRQTRYIILVTYQRSSTHQF